MDNQGDLFGGWIDPATQPLAVDGWKGSVVFSPCGKYRYELHREWPDGEGSALVIMCNPSDANALENDPTVARVCGFARAARLRQFTVTNMFAFIATKPADMMMAGMTGVDIVGPDNDETIARLSKSATIVVMACGNMSSHTTIARYMRQRAQALCFCDGPLAGRELHALRVTKDGAPSHPLYLPSVCKFEPYSRADLERWCTGKAV